MIKKESISRSQIRVTFELPASVLACHISVVGDFSESDELALPMSQAYPDANWTLTLQLKPGRRYRFRYLIDGQEWLNDWHADDFVENPFGSYDSVLDLTKGHQPSPPEPSTTGSRTAGSPTMA